MLKLKIRIWAKITLDLTKRLQKKNPVRRGRDGCRVALEDRVEHLMACYAPSISLLMGVPGVLT